jgi:alcohol dehydrogenase
VSWAFYNPVRIHAGPGALNLLPQLLSGEGALLLVASPGFRERGGVARIEQLVAGRELHVLEDVTPNPDRAHVEKQRMQLASLGIGEVVAIGGGSVLDTGKILASALGVRVLCVPTTAGTGSEVTPFATVWDHAAKKKLSTDVRHPDVALLDPELTLTLPEEVTLSTGLDALTQAFESTWSRRANPVSTAFAVRAIRMGLQSLPLVLRQPENIAARSAMLETSLLAGLAISHTRTALGHSMSYPITARFGLPHGYACGFTLPEVFAFNRSAEPGRFEALAKELGFATADDLESRMRQLLDELAIGRRIQRYVGDGSGLAALAPEMLTPGRADNNLREATAADVAAIVDAACHNRGLRSNE